MNEDERVARRARGEEFIAKLISVAKRSSALVEAANEVLEPDARVHLQNGDVVPPTVSQRQAVSTVRIFPDLEVEFVGGLFPDDRVVVRVRMTGTSPGWAPFAPTGGAVHAEGAFIARVTPRLTVSELWTYVNPGFGFAFPPRRVRLAPPPEDGASEADARALYERWVRSAEAGDDFVTSIAGSLARDGVVHLGNGDVADGAGFEDLFARIASGLHDLAIEIEDVMFDGPSVIAPFAMTGMHRGTIGMLAPTGRRLPSKGALIARADASGRAAEAWIYMAPAYAVTFPPGRSVDR